MTIEEKATAYDKAVEKARNFELPEYQRIMKELFPELRMTKYIDKDKELTRKDIEIILGIENNILRECNDNSQLVIEAYPKGEDYYGEILRRFNNQRIKPQRMVSAEAKEALYDKPAWSEEDMKEALRTEYEKGRADTIAEIGGNFIEDDSEEFDIAIETLKEAGQFSSAKWLESIKDRILPKHEWRDEDENGLGDALWAIKQARTIAKDENDMGNLWYAENWLNSIKNRIQPKQEWSKEDEARLMKVIWYVDNPMSPVVIKDTMLVEWLKQLKQRIGG